MKAICLHNPWAQLMAIGEKKIETRSWRTKYFGDIAICSSKSTESLDVIDDSVEIANAIGCVGLWYGRVLCVVEIFAVASTEMVDIAKLGKEFHFGNYAPDRYAFFTRNLRTLANPIPVRSFQKIFNLPESVAAAVAAQLPTKKI